MIILYVILLAVIQAVTEFLPVSSFGYLCTVEQLLGMGHDTGILLETMLHLGTAAAIIFLYKKDLKKVGAETLCMCLDMIGNLNLYIHNKKTGKNLRYAKIVHGSYRKFAALLAVSMIPTVLLGLTSRKLAELSAQSSLVSGIGFLFTGMFLLVTDLNGSGGQKGPKEAAYHSAMWIGICQGIAVFPGISRMGLTICAALLCGYSRKFAVKFSVFMSLPALIGAFLTEMGYFASQSMTAMTGVAYVLGMIVAGFAGCLLIRWALRVTQKTKLRYFAYYSFVAGAAALAVNYLV